MENPLFYTTFERDENRLLATESGCRIQLNFSQGMSVTSVKVQFLWKIGDEKGLSFFASRPIGSGVRRSTPDVSVWIKNISSMVSLVGYTVCVRFARSLSLSKNWFFENR